MAVSKHFVGLALLLATLGSEVGNALTVVGTAVPVEAETEKAKPRAMTMVFNCMMIDFRYVLNLRFLSQINMFKKKYLRYQTDEGKDYDE